VIESDLRGNGRQVAPEGVTPAELRQRGQMATSPKAWRRRARCQAVVAHHRAAVAIQHGLYGMVRLLVMALMGVTRDGFGRSGEGGSQGREEGAY